MKINIKYIFTLSIATLSVFFFEKCATIGRPSGGDKDTLAPVLVSAEPEMYTVNFDAKRITLGFDEYVQVRNLDKELIISPPIKKKPQIWSKGKGFYFDIEEDELKDSSTYIFNFGNAVTDINESNPFVNFIYVFSTGSAIDSFGISGTVLESKTLKPSKDPVSVMLFDNLEDSIPLKEKPLYVGRSLEDGSYNMEYIKPGTYRLFALIDKNSNLIYDGKDEQIAFSDSLITFDPGYFKNLPLKDTIQADSLQNDSIKQDTIIEEAVSEVMMKIYGIQHDLYYFKEEIIDTIQKLNSYGLEKNKRLYFGFNQPLTDSFSYRLQYYPDKKDWFFEEFSPDHDSINIWITDTTVLRGDTLNLILRYYRPDTLFNPYLSEDTLLFRAKPRIERDRDRRKIFDQSDEEEAEKKEYLVPTFNIKNNQLVELNDTFYLNTLAPIYKIDTGKIMLEQLVDTLWLSEEYDILKDSVKYNLAHIKLDLEEDKRYRFTFYDSALFDLYGLTNDTTLLNFSSKRLDQYGTLNVNMLGVNDQVILQLINAKEKIFDEKIITESQMVKFEYIKPAEYKLKIIYDSNRNGKWDTGKYLDKRQPEKVSYFGTTIKIRENWEHEEEWDISEQELIRK